MKISNRLTDEEIITICNIAMVINCNCPSYLIQILQQVRKFKSYLNECIEQFPQDLDNHQWLETQIVQMEEFMHQTILDFLQRENLIDEENHLQINTLMERLHLSLLTDNPSEQQIDQLLKAKSSLLQYRSFH